MHTEKLIQWSSKRAYLKYLHELEKMGIVSRGTKYLAGMFSKSLTLEWNHRGSDQAILYSGRSINTIEDTVKLIYVPRDFRLLLESCGASYDGAYRAIRRIFDCRTKEETYN